MLFVPHCSPTVKGHIIDNLFPENEHSRHGHVRDPDFGQGIPASTPSACLLKPHCKCIAMVQTPDDGSWWAETRVVSLLNQCCWLRITFQITNAHDDEWQWCLELWVCVAYHRRIFTWTARWCIVGIRRYVGRRVDSWCERSLPVLLAP